MLKLCMQDYKAYGVEEIDHGNYSVDGSTCVEAQINGVVARISLSAIDYDDFLANKSKYLPVNRKRKLEKYEESKQHRKNKIIKQTAIDGRNAYTNQMFTALASQVKRFNGDKLPGKRQRKPNTKFLDYVLPSNYNLLVEEQDTDDSNYTVSDDEQTTQRYTPKMMKSAGEVKKARGFKPRIKERILSHTDDEQKTDNHINVDPLDIQHDTDIVHSFLPQFETILDSDEEENAEKEKPKSKLRGPLSKSKNALDAVLKTTSDELGSLIKSSDGQTLPGSGSPQPFAILASTLKDGKVVCMPLILTTNSQNAVINVNDANNQSLAKFNQPDSRWVQIQPKPPSYRPLTNRGTPKSNAGKSKGISKSKTLTSYRYSLVDSDVKYKPGKVSDIDFNKLVRSLKLIKLPAKNWKIRIIVSPQETITEVIFTNKEEIERCIKFTRATAGYKITFGKSEVKLLGAPTLQTFDDIATMLDIINTIIPESRVLEYC